MPFKLNADGTIATGGEGDKKMPIFVYPDGKESPLDGDSTVATITRLNGEAKSHREAKEAAEAFAKPFRDRGIEDADAAAKAMEMTKNLKDGDLVAAGKVEEIKAAAKRAAEESVAAANKQAATDIQTYKTKAEQFEQQLYSEKIGGGFSRSKFVAEKLAIPADLVQARFGSAFKVEDGKVVGYDQSGNKIFSRARPGDLADFDEALETLVDHYPHAASILKSSGASGGGASNSGGNAGKKTYTRAQFSQLSPQEQSSVGLEAAQGKAVIVNN